MSKYVGGVSGGALGYIVGNVPGAIKGAIAGYNLGKKYSNMGSYGNRTPSRRGSMGSNSRTLVGPVTPGKRRRSVVSQKSTPAKKNKTIDNRGSLKYEKPVAQTAVTVRHKQVIKGFKGKGKKRVKVSKKLREKVKKVLEAKKVYGNARVVIHGGKFSGNAVNNIKQAVWQLPIPQESTVNRGVLFDRQFLMYVASRLFNGRPAYSTGLTAGKWSDIYLEKVANNWHNFSDDLFNKPSAFCMTVHTLKAKITMKNNTTRTQYLKMYVCKPKHDQNDNQTYPRGYAVNHWENGLSIDGAARVTGYPGQAGPPVQYEMASAVNISNTHLGTQPSLDIEDMYSDPLQCESFKKEFNTNVYAIVLEPGQVHEHWVEGDVGEYDYSKFYTSLDESTQFNNRAKTDRHIFFTSVPEMAVGATGDVGRLRTGLAVDQICFETQIFCKISMPETAGFLYMNEPLAGQSQMHPLTQRKRAYFLDNFWALETTQNFTNNVDDNNPMRQGQ